MTKSEKWEKYFLNYYRDVKKIKYYYQQRTTIVRIHGFFRIQFSSVCSNGDKWCFEKGFYVAYIKALKHKIEETFKLKDSIQRNNDISGIY